MTVADLIAKLQALVDADASTAQLPVLAEGCDCDGDAVDAFVFAYGVGRAVLVARQAQDTHSAVAEHVTVEECQ